jgi:hypothetical protein
MNDLYKIETYSESCAQKIASFIMAMGGKCVVQGWAVITDHCFSSAHSVHLVPIVSRISADLSDSDLHCWTHRTQLAA